jgi:hypothetical protein
MAQGEAGTLRAGKTLLTQCGEQERSDLWISLADHVVVCESACAMIS